MTKGRKTGGRQLMRSKKLDDELIETIANGETIRHFCREKKLSPQTVYSWLKEDKDLFGRVAHARELGALQHEDEIMEIADRRDRTDADDVQHRKLQIYAREKRLAWNNPSKYGTKVGIGGAQGLPPVLTETERVLRLGQLLKKAGIEMLPVKQLELVDAPAEELTDD